MDKFFIERKELLKEINIQKKNLKQLENQLKDANYKIYTTCEHKWEKFTLGYTCDERPKKCAICHFVK